MVAEIGDVRRGKGRQLIEDLWKEAEKAVKSPEFGFRKMWIRVSERPDDFNPFVSHRSIKFFNNKPTPQINSMVFYCDWDAGRMDLIRCLPRNLNIILPEHLEHQAVDEVVIGSVSRMIDHYK